MEALNKRIINIKSLNFLDKNGDYIYILNFIAELKYKHGKANIRV